MSTEPTPPVRRSKTAYIRTALAVVRIANRAAQDRKNAGSPSPTHGVIPARPRVVRPR